MLCCLHLKMLDSPRFLCFLHPKKFDFPGFCAVGTLKKNSKDFCAVCVLKRLIFRDFRSAYLNMFKFSGFLCLLLEVLDFPEFLCCLHLNLDGPNRQSPIASVQRTRSTLAGHSAGLRGTNTTPTNANRAIRIAMQRTQGLRRPNSVFFRERYDRQWTLAIRIAAITLASDSATTLARFRPSKHLNMLKSCTQECLIFQDCVLSPPKTLLFPVCGCLHLKLLKVPGFLRTNFQDFCAVCTAWFSKIFVLLAPKIEST